MTALTPQTVVRSRNKPTIGLFFGMSDLHSLTQLALVSVEAAQIAERSQYFTIMSGPNTGTRTAFSIDLSPRAATSRCVRDEASFTHSGLRD